MFGLHGQLRAERVSTGGFLCLIPCRMQSQEAADQQDDILQGVSEQPGQGECRHNVVAG